MFDLLVCDSVEMRLRLWNQACVMVRFNCVYKWKYTIIDLSKCNSFIEIVMASFKCPASLTVGTHNWLSTIIARLELVPVDQ